MSPGRFDKKKVFEQDEDRHRKFSNASRIKTHIANKFNIFFQLVIKSNTC